MRLPSPGVLRCLSLVLAAGLFACSDSESTTEVEASIPDVQGSYTISGTYDGRSGDSGVEGTLVISDQVEGLATATVALKVRDNGDTSFALNMTDPAASATSDPVEATVAADGSVLIILRGPEVITGIDPDSCCNYTYQLRGTFSAGTISGRWSLSRDMPSFDEGSFTATR